MALTVEQLSSAVTVEPGPPGADQAPSADHPWDRLTRFEATRDRLGEDELRIRAEGFDD